MSFIRKIALLTGSLCLLASCEKYDSSSLSNSISDLETRVLSLEQSLQLARSELATMSALASMVSEGQMLRSVGSNSEGDLVLVTMDGRTFTIRSGVDGYNAPSLTLVREGNCYYWGLADEDGTVSLIPGPDADRIPASGSGTLPELRIIDGKWEYSIDGRQTWIPTGVECLSDRIALSSCSLENGVAKVEFSNGTRISVPVFSSDGIRAIPRCRLFFANGQSRTVMVKAPQGSRCSVFKPAGWNAELRDTVLTVTAPPSGNAFADTEGTVSIVALTSSGLSCSTSFPVSIGSDGTDLSESDFANCYIVSGPGRYSFNAGNLGNGDKGILHVERIYMGRDIQKFHCDNSDISPVRLELLWEDCPGLISDIRLEDLRASFTASADKGNALIAAYDAEGQIVWSWHIWCTDEPAVIGLRTYGLTGKDGYLQQMQDRNLGATTTDVRSPDAFGMFYQWGRKDPFVGASSLNSPNGQSGYRPLYGKISSQGFAIPTTDVDIAEGVRHPDTFYVGIAQTGHNYYFASQISYVQPLTLWGNPMGGVKREDRILKDPTEKTIYDPCPPGFHVPHSQFLTSFVPNSLTVNNAPYVDRCFEFTLEGQGDFSFAAPGFIRYDSGVNNTHGEKDLLSVGKEATFWTSAPLSPIASSAIFGKFYWSEGSTSTFVLPYSDNYRSFGRNIRCVRDIATD